MNSLAILPPGGGFRVQLRPFRSGVEVLLVTIDSQGDAGIVDVTMLLGWDTGVSLTLMAFDVPSNATGLEQ